MVNMDDKSEPTLFDKIKDVLIKIQDNRNQSQHLLDENERLEADLLELIEALPMSELQQETTQQELKEEKTVDIPESVVTETNNVVGAMKTCYPQKKTFETERSSCKSTDSCLGFEVQPITAGSTVVSSSNLEDKGSTNPTVDTRKIGAEYQQKGGLDVMDEHTVPEGVVPQRVDFYTSSQETSEDASYICYVESPYNGEFDREPTEEITLDSVFQLELASRDAKQAIVSFVGNSVTMEGFLRNPQKMSLYGMEIVGDYKRPMQIETETPGEAELRADGKWHLIKPVKVKLV